MDGFGRPVPIELRMLLKGPIHPIGESGLFRIVDCRLSHGREKRPSEGSPEPAILSIRNKEAQIPRSTVLFSDHFEPRPANGLFERNQSIWTTEPRSQARSAPT